MVSWTNLTSCISTTPSYPCICSPRLVSLFLALQMTWMDLQKIKKNIIYLFALFLAVLGLICCTLAFSSSGMRAFHCGGFPCCGTPALGSRALVVVACGLSSCSTQDQLPLGTWDLLGSGIELVSLAFQGGFLTTGPPRKPHKMCFNKPCR